MTWPQYLRRECSWHGRTVSLGRVQVRLVLCLLLNRGRPVSLQRMIEFCYPNPDLEPESAENCIVQIARTLRRKMPGLIEHIPMQGYVIGEDDR